MSVFSQLTFRNSAPEPQKKPRYLQVTARDKYTGISHSLLFAEVTPENVELWVDELFPEEFHATESAIVQELANILDGAMARREPVTFRAAPDESVVIDGRAWASFHVRVRRGL